MTYENANALLVALAEQGFMREAPINVDRIAELLNLEVSYDPRLGDQHITGQIEFRQNGAVITIDPFDNSYEPRRRFTLAHEIGHYCLHINSQRTGFIDSRSTMSRSASYWDTYESEANNFAAQLLMPADLVMKIGSDVLADYSSTNSVGEGMPAERFVEQMAKRFAVSKPAMEYRLKAMDVL